MAFYLQQALLKNDFQKSLNKIPIRAILGDASGVLYDTQNVNSGYVWVRQQTSNGLSTAQRVRGPYQGAPVQMVCGNPVILKLDTDGQLFVYGPDFQGAVAQGINPGMNNASDENASQWTNQASIVTLVSHCTAPPSLSVLVRGWMAISNLVITRFSGASIDLTSFVPSAGNQRLVVIVVKSDFATLAAYASTTKDATDVLTIEGDVQECLTAAAAVDANAIPIWAWRLHDAQTTITDKDSWLDLRQFIDIVPLMVGSDGVNNGKSGAVPAPAAADQFKWLRGDASWRFLAATDIPNLDASKITTGQLALARGGTHADLSATGPGALWQTSNGADISSVEPVIIRAKNVSGATANANEVGIVSYDATNGYSYNTTTTANLDGMWGVVVVGAANNSDIFVARAGRVTVKLNANCSIGNFLVTSTTAGQAGVKTNMRPEVFAVALTANAGGAGGTCTALLLCNTKFVPKTNANYIWSCETHSTTAFVATINGAPSATSVVYNAPSSGAADVLVPGSGSPFVKQRLWNTTRSSFRLISSVNTGTKTITTVSSTDSWASGDTITIESQTVTTGSSFKAIELDLSQSVQTNIPITARALNVQVLAEDTGAIASSYSSAVHPFETYAASKLVGQNPAASSVVNYIIGPMPIIDYVITWLGIAQGTATHYTYLRLNGWWEAAP